MIWKATVDGFEIEMYHDGYQWFFGAPETYDAEWISDGYSYSGIHGNLDAYKNALRDMCAEIAEAVAEYKEIQDAG